MKKVFGIAALLLMFNVSSYAYIFIGFGAIGNSSFGPISWGECRNGRGICVGSAIGTANPTGDVFTLSKDGSSLTLQLSERHKEDMKDIISSGAFVLNEDSGISLDVMKELGDVTGGYFSISAGKYELKTDGKFFYVTVNLKQQKK